MSQRAMQFTIARPAELRGGEVFHGTLSEASSVRHLHEAYRFGIAEHGTWRTRYRGVNLTVGPGHMQFAQPGEVSACEFHDDQLAAFRCVSVPAGYLTELDKDVRGSRPSTPFFRQHLVANPRASAEFAAIHERLMRSTSALERSSLFNELLFGLLHGFAELRPAKSPADPAPHCIRQACDFIEDDLAANPSLQQLAALCGLSTFHFNRAFRRCTGLPPHAYQNHRRILKATALLATGRSSSEIAALLGFADQSHFIRHFKKQLGLTPESYRNSLLREFT